MSFVKYTKGLLIYYFPHALFSNKESNKACFSIISSSVSVYNLSGILVASVKFIPLGGGYQ